jgi:hypothetical protein
VLLHDVARVDIDDVLLADRLQPVDRPPQLRRFDRRAKLLHLQEGVESVAHVRKSRSMCAMVVAEVPNV